MFSDQQIASCEPLLQSEGEQGNGPLHSRYATEVVPCTKSTTAPGSELDNINQKPGAQSKKAGGRVYYVDWMRILQIYMVVCFHTMQALDDYVRLFEGDGGADPALGYKQSGVVPTQSRVILESFQTYCLMIGMPMFFYVSGRSQALGKHKKSFPAHVISRTQRLLIPFLVAYCLLIPVWMYMRWPPAPVEAQKSLWSFELWYWSPEGFSFQIAWLWFLPTLFLCDVGATPLLRFTETKSLLDLLLAALVVVANSSILHHWGHSWRYLFWAHFAGWFGVLLTIFIPFADKHGECSDGKLMTWILNMLWERFQKHEQPYDDAKKQWHQIFRWIALRLSAGLQILASVFMVSNFEYDDLKVDGTPGLMIFFGIYIHGYLWERWSQGNEDLLLMMDPKLETNGVKHRNGKCALDVFRKLVNVYELVIFLSLVMIAAVSAPAGRRERMLYPAFSAGFEFEQGSGVRNIGFGVSHVMGTWAWIGIWPSICQAYLNIEIQPDFYRHASASTTIVYIFHWMFLKGFCVFVLDKYELKGTLFWKCADVIILLCFAIAGSLMVYWALLRSPRWFPIGKLFGLSVDTPKKNMHRH